MRIILGALLVAVLVATGSSAQVPGAEDAATDGIPFELDDEATLARITSIMESISGQAVHDCVQDITTGPYAYRLMGVATHDLFVQEHRSVFADLGLVSGLQEFSQGGALGVGQVVQGGTNIVGALPGTDLMKWVVIGGHYDTREGTIGALDNTSGICTVYELARALKADTDANGPYNATVVFNWYDGEEWGLYGAIAFADDLNFTKRLLGLSTDDAVDVMVSQSFDMPGINYPARNVWVQYPEDSDPNVNTEKLAVLNLRTAPIHTEDANGEPIDWLCRSYGCYEELKEREDFKDILHNFTHYQFLVREVVYDLMAMPPDHVWVYDDDYGRSDHMPLIARGAAGMRIQGSHDEEYPCYHQPCDTLQWLYVNAGSQAELIQGYEAEARAGGVTAAYVALTGAFGQYGAAFLNETAAEVDPVAKGPADARAPWAAPALALLALAAVAVARR